MHSPLPVLHPVCNLSRGSPIVSSPVVADGPSSSSHGPFAPSISPSPSSASTHTVHAPTSHHPSSSAGGSGSSSSVAPTPSFLGHLSPTRISPPSLTHLTASRSPLPQEQQQPTPPACTTQSSASSFMVISPPRTPTPGGRPLRQEGDREGVHGGLEGKGVDGIEYGRGWVESLQVLERVGGTTVRAVSAQEVSSSLSYIDLLSRERERERQDEVSGETFLPLLSSLPFPFFYTDSPSSLVSCFTVRSHREPSPLSRRS